MSAAQDSEGPIAGEVSDAPPAEEPQKVPGRKVLLWLLTGVLTFNFADISLISAISPSLAAEFNLTDLQIGLISSCACLTLIAAMGPAFAWLADRQNRRWLITGSMAMWGGLTVASGFALNFWQILAARTGASIGHAGVTPAAHSIISGYYPAGRRARALAIYSFGIPLGATIAAMAGPWITSTYGWRTACIAFGVPGLVIALLFRLFARSGPPRPTATDVEAFAVAHQTPKSKASRSFIHLAFGLTLASFVGFAYLQFTLTMLQRNYRLGFYEAGFLAALIHGVSAVAGMFAGGALAQRFARTDIRYHARIAAFGCLVAPIIYWFALTHTSLIMTVTLMCFASMFGMLHFAPALASVQDIAPPHRRAMASATAFFWVTIGMAFGPFVIGALSDNFQHANFVPPLMRDGLDFVTACDPRRPIPDTEEACAVATASGLTQALLVCLPLYFWAAIHFARAARFLREDTGLTLPPKKENSDEADENPSDDPADNYDTGFSRGRS